MFDAVAWFASHPSAHLGAGPFAPNLRVLLDVLEVYNAWEHACFRDAVAAVLAHGFVDAFCVLARVSGVHTDRGVFFSFRKKVRALGFGRALEHLHTQLA